MTARRVVTDDQFGRVALKTWELEKRVKQGTLDPETVCLELQRVIEGKFVELPYADEEVDSTYGYPEGWRLKTVSDQLTILQGIKEFKALDVTQVAKIAESFSELPEGADGLAVIPKPSKVAQSYNEATVLMSELMAEHRKDWHNYRKGRVGPEYLRLTEKTEQTLARLEKEIPGDYLVIPVQTGLRHRGRSVRRARVMMSANEWGLGPYEVGIILLVHPERLQKYEHLAIDCAGCEYSPGADGRFDDCFFLSWDDGKFRFGSDWADDADEGFGSASAFG